MADPGVNAEDVPDALAPQVPIIVDVLAALGHRAGRLPRLRGRRRHRHPGHGARPSPSTSSPATATCSSSSTTRAACASSTPPRAASRRPEVSTRPRSRRATAIPGRAYADFAALRGDTSRRPARRPRRRREDRGVADLHLRVAGRRPRGRRGAATRRCVQASTPRSSPRATTSRWRRASSSVRDRLPAAGVRRPPARRARRRRGAGRARRPLEPAQLGQPGAGRVRGLSLLRPTRTTRRRA